MESWLPQSATLRRVFYPQAVPLELNTSLRVIPELINPLCGGPPTKNLQCEECFLDIVNELFLE